MSSLYRVVNCRGKGRKTPLHTDEDCYRLQRAKSYRLVERVQFPDAPLCPNCGGES